MLIRRPITKQQIKDPASVHSIFVALLRQDNEVDRDKEHFWCIGLNTRNCVKYIELVSLGTLNASLVHPREVFRFAIMQGVASIIVIHNHPSGDPEPSEDDLRLVKRLIEAGRLLGIELLDSLIVADSYLSFKEKGLI